MEQLLVCCWLVVLLDDPMWRPSCGKLNAGVHPAPAAQVRKMLGRGASLLMCVVMLAYPFGSCVAYLIILGGWPACMWGRSSTC